MKILILPPALVFFALQVFAQTEPASRDTQNKDARTSNSATVENNAFAEYISQFKKVAIIEMHRASIPASITLAQAVLESGGGESELAKQANNHFGIKCGTNWGGKTYLKQDDDRDADGNVLKSCFRKYNKAEESFFDHSEFICDPRKSARYGFLFLLDQTDYKSWARGLQSAGYASSEGYADKLIDLIERYSLFQYDRPETQASLALTAEATNRIGYVNNVKMVFSRADERLEDIARKFRLDVEQLVEYNERGYSTGVPLPLNTRIFIQEKQKKWRGRLTYHIVQEGQTMFDISQWYGIKLDKLLSRNGLQSGQEPAIGEQVRLRGRSIFNKKTVLIYKAETGGN